MTDTLALEFQDTNGVWWQLFLPSMEFTYGRSNDETPASPAPHVMTYSVDGLLALFRGEAGHTARFVTADVARRSPPSSRGPAVGDRGDVRSLNER